MELCDPLYKERRNGSEHWRWKRVRKRIGVDVLVGRFPSQRCFEFAENLISVDEFIIFDACLEAFPIP